MKKLLVILFSFIITQSSFAADSKNYFRADYGMGKFTSEKLGSLNANPTGSTWGAAFGARMSYIELGFFFKKFDYSADITHDSVANKIIHDGKSFGVDMNIFLNNYLSLKLGYSINNYSQKIKTPTNAVTDKAIKLSYGLEDDKNNSNFYYGANIDLFGSKKWDVSFSVVRFPMDNGKNSTSASLGLRLYMDGSLSSFFGTN